jgi:hypothetical protein
LYAAARRACTPRCGVLVRRGAACWYAAETPLCTLRRRVLERRGDVCFYAAAPRACPRPCPPRRRVLVWRGAACLNAAALALLASLDAPAMPAPRRTSRRSRGGRLSIAHGQVSAEILLRITNGAQVGERPSQLACSFHGRFACHKETPV